MDWLDLLAVQGTLKSLLQHHSSKASILQHSAFFTVQLSHPLLNSQFTILISLINRRCWASFHMLIGPMRLLFKSFAYFKNCSFFFCQEFFIFASLYLFVFLNKSPLLWSILFLSIYSLPSQTVDVSFDEEKFSMIHLFFLFCIFMSIGTNLCCHQSHK